RERAEGGRTTARGSAAGATTGVRKARVGRAAGGNTAAGGVQQAEAAVTGAEHEIQVAQPNRVAAQSRQREKEATATKAAHDVDRLKGLVQKDEISQQQFDAAVAAADAARASADAAKSEVTAAQSGITVPQQRAAQSRGTAEQARATLETAKTAPQQLQVTQARAPAPPPPPNHAPPTLPPPHPHPPSP